MLLFSIVSLVGIVACNDSINYTKAWHDYVAKPEPHYGWEDTGTKWDDPITGSTIYKLNVTSLQWLNSTVYDVPIKNFHGDPSIWKHETFVIVPPVIKHRNLIMVWATGGCN